MSRASATFITAFLVLSGPVSSAAELCTLVVDAATGSTVASSGASCARRVTPASTFKIAISLMGFDSGLLHSSHRPIWPYRDGYPDWAGDAWKGEIDPANWMKKSVFWYSQQVVKELGQARFESYVTSFEYGNQDASAVQVRHPQSNGAWVMSSLQISPIEQVAFLRRLANRQLPVSAHAYEMTEEITRQDELNGWRIYGKTGTGSPGQDNKYRADQAYGWYVGWARKGAQAMVFVRLIQDEKAQSTNAGLRARSQMSEQLLSVTSKR
ncbi:class D beta-lactamase [Comamonas sp. Tr-654]|uniref:class D beta-lactamase n=1 Tax=Comamonas sp. Tr-654 TaxID=2608341 RepID=UPI0014205731|nr:class D beta-lactamase [Comamonas sp. Tr-654]NIF82525.1 class D beta-lactamase [Comamonas sp. Tr-654]